MLTKPGSTADVIAASLRDMINQGELPEGARLIERELASTLPSAASRCVRPSSSWNAKELLKPSVTAVPLSEP